MTTPRPLRAVPAGHPTAAGGDSLDLVAAAETHARAEVERARRDLPGRDPVLFDCYLGSLVREVQTTTEADPIAVLASLLCASGVYLGQGPHVRAGDDRHPLLVWPLIIGRTNAGRKGSSWSTAKRLLVAADDQFMTTNIRTGLTSGEGLAAMFTEPDTPAPAGHHDQDRDSDDGEEDGEQWRSAPVIKPGHLPPGDRRLLVFESEWGGVMSRMRREGNSLSMALRAAWEGGDLSTLNVSARIAPSSHVGVLAHITPEEFRDKLTAAEMAGGTYNRFLPLAVARTQFLPLSTGADPAVVDQLGDELVGRLRRAIRTGALGFTGDGAALWRALYVEFGSDHGDTGPVEQFISRTAPNCLRIAAIHAALDHANAITDRHLSAAAALVRYSIASARAVFTADPTLTRLAAWIADAGPIGRTREEIRSDFFGRNKKADQINALLEQLITAGHITRNSRPRSDGRPGRATEVFLSAHPPERG